MSKISYQNKDNTAAAGTPERQWRDVDANEVKTSVNALYDQALESFNSVADVKTYSGDAKTILLRTNFDNQIGGGGSTVTVNMVLKYIGEELTGGGNDLTKIQSTAKTGHWRMISASPRVVFDHDFGSGGGSSLTNDIFSDLEIHDLRVFSKNQDLTFELDAISSTELTFNSTIYGQIKIEIQ